MLRLGVGVRAEGTNGQSAGTAGRDVTTGYEPGLRSIDPTTQPTFFPLALACYLFPTNLYHHDSRCLLPPLHPPSLKSHQLRPRPL